MVSVGVPLADGAIAGPELLIRGAGACKNDHMARARQERCRPAYLAQCDPQTKRLVHEGEDVLLLLRSRTDMVGMQSLQGRHAEAMYSTTVKSELGADAVVPSPQS